MTGIIQVDTIQNEAANTSLNPVYFNYRIIQRFRSRFNLGYWNADNNYRWVPGCFCDFKPMRGDTRIRFRCSFTGRYRGNSHSISHWIFYVDGNEIGRHSIGGQHRESGKVTEWDVPSWGAGQIARIGYKYRDYSNGNHGHHMRMTNYWDGGGPDRRIPSEFCVEEYHDA